MPDSRARAGGGGFTLLEMVIVLTIIGLTIGLAMPWLGRGQGGVGLNAAAGEIRTALHSARSAAIADGRAVVFRGDGGGYWLGAYHYPLDPAGDRANRLRVATGGGVLIAFYPSGASSGGRVFVEGAGGRREIAVDAVTGRATLLP